MMRVACGRHAALAASVLLHAGGLLAWQLSPPAETQARGAPLQLTLQGPGAPAGAQPASARTTAEPPARPHALPTQRPGGHTHSGASVAQTGAHGILPAGPGARRAASVPAASVDPAMPTASPSRRNEPQPFQQPARPDTEMALPAVTSAAAALAAPAAHSTGAAAAPPNPPTSGSDRHAQVRASLDEAFAAHFHYPMLARRKGWEGEVTIGLRVETDGRLTGIHLLGSSGHRILDNAAIDSLLRARALPPQGGLPGAGLDLVLPVHYRLLDTRV